MDIRTVDLNLLLILDAMFKHRNVTRAAEAVGLSQPATSGAVARLRVLFGDPLFVKSGAEMKPTPRAIELADHVHLVVETISRNILQNEPFDPTTSNRTFSVLTPDIGEISFVPRVSKLFALAAPYVDLRVHSKPRDATAAALESGEADLAIGYFPDLLRPGFFQQRLFRTTYVCVACERNSAMGANPTIKEFLAAKHVVVRPEGRQHLFESFLLERRLQRRIAVEVSHFMSLLEILPGSDLISTIPTNLAETLARYIKIKMIKLPMRPPTIDVFQFWHQRYQKDPGNAWLRQQFHRKRPINDVWRN